MDGQMDKWTNGQMDGRTLQDGNLKKKKNRFSPQIILFGEKIV
jgi:hypothetical protein